MAKYSINKGIDQSTEFKGLRSQYLFIFAGGLLAIFVVFAIMYIVGINQWVCIGFTLITSSLLIYFTFWMNDKYGTHGLMKLMARKSHPKYIINRRSIINLFSETKKRSSYEE